MSKSDTLYHLQGVRQIYNGRTVLNIDDLRIRRGEILGLVGPSGAGKSTLLRLLGFLEKPSGGQIRYQGQICDEHWPTLNDRRRVTMVFQHPQLLRRTVFDNVAYGLKIRNLQNGQSPVLDILKKLGLKDLSTSKAQTLSGGEAQRVALARALVIKPDVLLLDEPTANLDPYNIKLIESIVQDVNREQKTTVIMVTHNVFQARRLADRIGLILSGKLVEAAGAEDFFERPNHPETAGFVRGDIVY